MKFETDPRVIVSIVDLLQGKVDKIKYKPGFSNADITSDRGTTAAYSRVFYKLMELMVMDVIAGDIVIFNRKTRSMLYVDTDPASILMIQGKNLEKRRIPLIDFSKTRYRVPIIAFDPGGRSTPCKVFIPMYLYSTLIDNMNAGKKYHKSTKVFWFNKKK